MIEVPSIASQIAEGTFKPAGTASGSGIIPAMQGFFVKANATSTLSVANTERVHSDQAYYKEETDNDIPILRLATTDINGLTDEAIIRFYEEATIEHDGNYDAYKLFGWMYPQLYSITPEQSELAINTLPAYENGTIVPLGFVAPEEGEYSINLSEFVNFGVETTIYLEDLFTNEMMNLKLNQEYVYSSSPEDDAHRFNLHFVKSAANLNEVENSNIQIYAYENKVYINSSDEQIEAVVMADILGREIFRSNDFDTSVICQRVKDNSGYIIVLVRTGTSVTSKKVFIK